MSSTINIKITSSCNYTCGMCPFHGEGYSADYFQERPEWKREMSLEEVETILIKAKEAGIEKIDFTPNGEFYFYPKIKSKVPNIFKQSLQECQKQSDHLYLNDIDFINYCKNCSLYAVNNSEVLERKFIESGYFAMQYATQTRYFIIPEYLRSIPQNILLFMYEKGMVSEIKKMLMDKMAVQYK